MILIFLEEHARARRSHLSAFCRPTGYISETPKTLVAGARNCTTMTSFEIRLRPLLLLLLLTATLLSGERYFWKPQGRFGKRENSGVPNFGPQIRGMLERTFGKTVTGLKFDLNLTDIWRSHQQ